MAETKNTDFSKKLARIQMLAEMLRDPSEAKRALAKASLSEEGYTVTQDGANGFTISDGTPRIPDAQAPTMERPDMSRSGSLSSRPPISTTRGASGARGSGPSRSGSLSGRAPIMVGSTLGEGGGSSGQALSPGQENQIRIQLFGGPQPAAATTSPLAPVSSEPGILLPAPGPGRSANSVGAPSQNDYTDSSGRSVPGAQSFARGLLNSSTAAEAALNSYKKANPSANINDTQLQTLQDNFARASRDAAAGAQWAGMGASARQAVLTQGQRAADVARGLGNVQQGAVELKNAQRDAAGRPTNLLEDLDYYNTTGVMRGGGGTDVSTTRAGGVISPNTVEGGRDVVSPYGTGFVRMLTPEQQANRPEGLIDGRPSSEVFQGLANSQARPISVGSTQYTPEGLGDGSDMMKAELDEARRKAELERRKFATSVIR